MSLGVSPASLALERLKRLKSVSLPKTFTGNLGIRWCDQWQTLALPGGKVKHLTLDGCTRMRVPENMHVMGNMHCSGLDASPITKGLTIDGGCEFLIFDEDAAELPAGLRVGGNLLLPAVYISELSLPSDLQVEGYIYVSHSNAAKLKIPTEHLISKVVRGETPNFESWWVG